MPPDVHQLKLRMRRSRRQLTRIRRTRKLTPSKTVAEALNQDFEMLNAVTKGKEQRT